MIMKKKILAFAIMAIAAVSAGNLFAQQPQAKEQTCPAQCQKARCADPLAAFQGITQIGRASCRERVCA